MIDTALRLGELHFVAGKWDQALLWAERARSASPYDERAHRLAVRRPPSARLAATRAMLAELAADPEPATEMLLRQTAARVGGLAFTPAR